MRTFLAVWTLVCVVYGVFILFQTQSGVHEIEAGIAFLIATVAGGTTALLDELLIVQGLLRQRVSAPPKPIEIKE